jgi:hypothetical protein
MSEMSEREELEEWLPKQAVLDLLEDIDNFLRTNDNFLRTNGFAELPDVASKREALQDYTKIVTMDTLIFLRGLLTWSGGRKRPALPAPWPDIEKAVSKLMPIVWLHVVWSGYRKYAYAEPTILSHDTYSDFQRDMRIHQFYYRKVLSGPQATDTPDPGAERLAMLESLRGLY